MAEEKKEETEKSHRNLFNTDKKRESGLPIMVNLYIIKYIYYHIKKANQFMDKENEGKKPKAIPIYGKQIPISRQRFDRINKGMPFEISAKEATQITDRFGIGAEYFRKDAPVMFKIEGLSERDWKGFYSDRYKVPYEDEVKDKEKCRKKVEQTLKRLMCANWEKQLKRSDPLFAIFYYFSYGEKIGQVYRANRVLQLLKEMNCIEWEQSRELLKEANTILKKHYQYTEGVLVVSAIREEQKKEKENNGIEKRG